MAQYRTTNVQFEELEKKLTRVFKKLDKVGATYTFQKIRDYVDTVPVYAIDEVTQTKYKVNEMPVECVEFELDFDMYKVGDYHVGAVVECTEGDENLVYTIDEDVNFQEYVTTPIRCDHCHTRHFRRQGVVLVNNENGQHIMVGKGCLKDYMGISVDTFARYLYGINEYLEDVEPRIWENEMHLYKCVIDTKTYLAYCVQRVTLFGYEKEITKYEALKEMDKNKELDPKYMTVAEQMIEFFNNYETKDTFENNVRLYVTGKTPITGENGLIAYAYTLYTRIQEKLAKEAACKEQVEKSGFVGNVGEKITVVGKMIAVTGYETEWGYTTIYKIVDENGNTFIWKTSTFAQVIDNNGYCTPAVELDKVQITGKIKDHNEYNGEKQTVLERCKVIAVA